MIGFGWSWEARRQAARERRQRRAARPREACPTCAPPPSVYEPGEAPDEVTVTFGINGRAARELSKRTRTGLYGQTDVDTARCGLLEWLRNGGAG